MGYLDEAQARSARAVSTAQELGDQYGLAFASAVGSMTLYLLGNDLHALQERAELCCSHCEKHGIAWWQYYAGAFLGWLAVTRGEVAPGIERMRGAMAAWQATGMLLGVDSHAVLLADACLKVMRFGSRGQDPLGADGRRRLLADAFAAVEIALAPGSPSGPCYEAELLRMRGELLLARGAGRDRRSIGLLRAGEDARGREQGTRTWELRATTSILALREATGVAEVAEARERLRELYGGFTEGFAFPDLCQAAALLQAADGPPVPAQSPAAAPR